MNQLPFVLIMAGGVGSRFWPASREYLPKQFLDITGSGKTLIQATYDRFLQFIPRENIYIVTNEFYRDQTLYAIEGLREDRLICEPTRNNTAASVALASLKLHKINPDAVCIVAPADHLISNENEFKRVIQLATEFAQNEQSIVTLGIQPTRPDTGYGYIEFEKNDDTGIRKVKSFREKPDLSSAKQYLSDGNFAWNSGLFIWRLDHIIDSFQQYSPQIYNVLAQGLEVYNTEEEIEFIKTQYPLTEKISVDYAILEKSPHVYTIPCDIGWSDLGTWNSLYDFSEKDTHGNVALSNPIFLQDTKDTLIKSRQEKLIVIKGLEDYIIIDTDDCLMIYPKSEEQQIKDLRSKLAQGGFDPYL